MATVPRLGAVPPRLAVDAFWSLFGCVEHEQLDFKRGVRGHAAVFQRFDNLCRESVSGTRFSRKI